MHRGVHRLCTGGQGGGKGGEGEIRWDGEMYYYPFGEFLENPVYCSLP